MNTHYLLLIGLIFQIQFDMSLFTQIKQAFSNMDGINDDFHPQFQLVSRARDEDNEDNLTMRIADPLWMLGRQWQFGEFLGEDNGSPISVVGKYFQQKVENFHPGANPATSLPLDKHPLEVQVEAMPIALTLREKVKIGQRFERLVRIHLKADKEKAKTIIEQFRGRYPLTTTAAKLDKATQNFANLMKDKVVNGGTLLDAIIGNQIRIPPFQGWDEFSDTFKAWCETLYFQPAKKVTTWQPEQLQHQFKVTTADKKSELNAPDYQSGHLDWYSFDKSTIDWEEQELVDNQKFTKKLFPINLSFPSMPNSRLFAFEDKRIDLGDMDIEADDLIRMMLIDFSLFSGSDWYTVPMEMEVGSLCWINEIEIEDVFGVTTIVKNGLFEDKDKGIFRDIGPSFSDVDNDGRRTSLDTWDVFKIRDRFIDTYHHPDHFLFLAPVINKRQESPPVEEVLFVRDEFANQVWGIEQKVQNEYGKTLEGFDLHLALNGPFLDLDTADTKTNDHPKYRLANTVPSNWIPYLPRTNGTLHQAMMVSNEPDKLYKDIQPLSHLIDKELKTILEEAVPKEGVSIQLTKQRTRWSDGRTYVWMGRKVLVGRGEGDSGLRFDYLKS